MSEYSIQSGTLSDIANAIRTKTGRNNAMTPLEMPTEIGSIGGGGGTEGSDWEITPKTYAKFNNNFVFFAPITRILADYRITFTFYQSAYTSAENLLGNSAGVNYVQLTVYDNKYYTSTDASETSFGRWSAGEHTFICNDGTGHNKFDGVNVTAYNATVHDMYLTIGYRQNATYCSSYIKSLKIDKISNGQVILDLEPCIFTGSLWDQANSSGLNAYVRTKYTNKGALHDKVNNNIYAVGGVTCYDSIPS